MSDRANNATEAQGEVCPEVLAIAASMGYVQPSKLRWLQRNYDRLAAIRAEQERDPKLSAPVLVTSRRGTDIGRGGSVSRSVNVNSQIELALTKRGVLR